jgi:hypothetical protein
MDEYTKQLIEGARAMYKDVVAGDDSRIHRGKALWDQFEAAADACRMGGKDTERQLGERINELAVAKVLADDKQLRGPITYEPNLLPSKRKIDFVADRLRDNLHVEVKTVHPDTADTEEAWNNYLKLRELHPKQANFIVHKDWIGGKLYGNTFASRSKFLDYTRAFEDRLAEAKKTRFGPGILVFCGNGVRWHRSNLEDFADFYHAGNHRQDDPFALMEKHEMERKGIKLLNNIDHFACLRRPMEQAGMQDIYYPVRGPSFGGVIK